MPPLRVGERHPLQHAAGFGRIIVLDGGLEVLS
jgi:hypothetical protein